MERKGYKRYSREFKAAIVCDINGVGRLIEGLIRR